MYKVSIVKCNDYQYKKVEEAVFQCLNSIPEIKSKIWPHAKVLIKANLARADKPEEAITTHPSVIQAIVRYFQIIQCRVVIGDSPGAPLGYTKKTLERVYKETGMMDVANNTGCELNYDTSVIEVINQEAVCLKKMTIIKIVEDADFVISAAKLKTHTMMMYTGAVKNLFGVIPGRLKMNYHLMMLSVERFSEHLVDICQYVKPVLSIIDAIECMEGNGPSAGDKRHAGLIMASENPYALDMTATHIVGINPLEVPAIAAAVKRNIFSGNIKNVVTPGVGLKDIKISPFQQPDTSKIGGGIPSFKYEVCTSCGVCVESCPPRVIDISSGRPVINLDECIKCFCCHELCPNKAVDIKNENNIYLGF
ncbi:DUF362 domain-containing protein [Alkaliphilus peptidifermentans]|uniref:Ferredoxin n=1 Tax=Alkaliphilus peptidifermentans DSM 18978 TaxID=1120976 RepID=A0A1G5K824_9FIRM|nr:DUF362 domain-containing protein [Alkaliphilus peptidifermentans]SCY96240.1 Uncharacterized conserved protein, DUF362 family [Alkaliphilus peptidifermentans DSM 18978]